MKEVYHEGEKSIQKLVGEEIVANSNGRVIVDTILKGAINFIAKQPMAIVSSVDNNQKTWVSLLIGDFGFVNVPSQKSLIFKKELIYSGSEDIFFRNIEMNNQVGSLFIELNTRRRFRVNGLAKTSEDQIELQVQEAYPNCPKYIQQRVISSPDNFSFRKSEQYKGHMLNKDLREWVLTADTLFVGSQSAKGQMDASHRGGNKGFVEIIDDGTLKVPDYRGNSMYNTLGNFAQNPNAGLLFVDFQNHRTLQLTGKSKIFFDQKGEDDLKKTTGTGRYWLFEIDEWILTEKHHSVNWEFLSYSPFNPE